MSKKLYALIYFESNETEKLELKAINFPEDLSNYLGEDFEQRISIANRTMFRIYSNKSVCETRVIIQLDDIKLEPVSMSLYDAYDWMYGRKGRLLPITDLRGLDEEELAEEGGYLHTDYVSWEATSVMKYEYDEDIHSIKTELAFFGRGGYYDEQQIGVADVTILDGEQPPYDLSVQADYISDVYVYALNGVPTYADDFDLEMKMERGRKPGVFGKVGIVTRWFIAGPHLDEMEARKPIVESMIDYFTNGQKIDFLVIHPNLNGVLDYGIKEKTKEEILQDSAEIGAFLQEEVGFIGSGDTSDGYYYSIDNLFQGYQPVEPKTKADFITMMDYCIKKGDLDRAIQVIEKGHNLGIAECTFELGMFHSLGLLGEIKKEQAYEYFYELAQDGFPPAMYETAQMLFKGEGARKNVLMAMMWLERAAEKGEERAVGLLEKFQKAQTEIATSGELYNLNFLDEE